MNLLNMSEDIKKNQYLFYIKHGHIKQALLTLILNIITTIERLCTNVYAIHMTMSLKT